MNTLNSIPPEAWSALITAFVTVLLSWLHQQGFNIPALSPILNLKLGGASAAVESAAEPAAAAVIGQAAGYTLTLTAEQAAELLLAQHGATPAKPAV